jgi:hypothetical protein
MKLTYRRMLAIVVLGALSVLTYSAIGSGPTSSVSSGGGTWGSITGTLSSQTDLNTALGLKATVASPTFTTSATAPIFIASGFTGSTAASRYMGAVASGAPASGAHVVGDWTIDQTGRMYICTVLGTPGTWVRSGSTISKTLVNITMSTADGSVLPSGSSTLVYTIPVASTITGWATSADVSGSVTIDVYKQAFSTSATPSVSVPGSGTKPALSTAKSAQGTSSDWSGTLACAVNDQVIINISGVATITALRFQLFGTEN